MRFQSDNLGHAQSFGLRPIAWFKFEMATATIYSGYICTGSTGSEVNLSHAQSFGLMPIAWFKFEMARATVYSDYSCTGSNVFAFETSRCSQRHRCSGSVFHTSRPQGLQKWNQLCIDVKLGLWQYAHSRALPVGPRQHFISIERVVLAPEVVGYCWHLFSASQFFDLVIYEASKWQSGPCTKL